MKLKFAAAAVLACAAFSASAADQTFAFTDPSKTFDFSGLAAPGDGLLSGGSDVLTFTGLAAGTYLVKLSYSGLDVNITSASLNGQAPKSLIADEDFSLGSFKITTTAPFTLTLNGVAGSSGLASYSGHINVTAVPEPATYGMLLGGLALVGAVARRKKQA